MRKQIMNRTRMLMAAAMLCGCAALQAAPTCSLASLSGNYGFTITGQILSGPSAGPVAGVALTTYNGSGGLTQVDHVVHNGQIPPEEWRSATGSYTLNADCTGTMQLIFSDGSPNLNLHIVVDLLAGQIHSVVDGDVAITSIGVRQGIVWIF